MVFCEGEKRVKIDGLVGDGVKGALVMDDDGVYTN